jgi:formylglycine-generating enzyme required for sulfatase activity
VPSPTAQEAQATPPADAGPQAVDVKQEIPKASSDEVKEAQPPTEPATQPQPAKPAVQPQPEAATPPVMKKVPATKKSATAKTPDRCPASLARTRKPICRDVLPDGGEAPVLVVLPAGSFVMGSEREPGEQPVHKVQIGASFAISAYEISVADYRRFCQATGRACPKPRWPGDDAPVVDVSWNDARAYTAWLSEVTGVVYRLPSEAEWEYAARGGSTSEYASREGDKILPSDARFETDSPVAVNNRAVNANGFRLRHMYGNVREWVADAWAPDYRGVPTDGTAYGGAGNAARVVRGGTYADEGYKLRAAAREHLPAGSRDHKTGFRVVREVN